MILNDSTIAELSGYRPNKNEQGEITFVENPDGWKIITLWEHWRPEAMKYRTVKLPMIDPFSASVQGGGVISYGISHAGYDLRLAPEILIFKNTANVIIDPKRFNDPDYQAKVFDRLEGRILGNKHGEIREPFVMPPHSYALGRSWEYLRIPDFIKGRCVGKSTLARCGILINTTPLEPGWEGHLTIEISNITPCQR